MQSKIKTIETKVGKITYVSFVNKSGAWVTLSSLGAGIVSVNVPDASGKLNDVVLGYNDPADYMADGPCAGKIPGRYANRIANGKFSLDGVDYSLPVNNGPNHLHGGHAGFQNKIWEITDSGDNFVTFTHTSPDGDAGYPGTLTVRATYRWTDDDCLSLEIEATTDAPTVVNLTNHTYFNLSGHDAGTAMKHRLRLNASNYLPTDSTLVPLGNLAPVKGTPMDFTNEEFVGSRITDNFDALKFGKGYDNCWAVDNYVAGKIQVIALLSDLESGRVVEISSDQPGVQVYTGNWLSGSPTGKSGAIYRDYDAVAIECQDFPDAPNKPEFPSTVLRPGEKYCRHISFRFSTLLKEAK